MKLPIQITEVEVNEDWEPDTSKQYIIEYEWKKGDRWWLIGRFYSVWFGYTFHWPWSASSLQLGIKGKSAMKNPDDWKQYKRVYVFEPHPEPDFIEKGDMKVE
jgi:hypothetical protein